MNQLSGLAGLTAMLLALFPATASSRIATSPANIEPLRAGDRIPAATVTTLEGKTATLDKILGNEKAILVVFRGGWCPFCTRHLAGIQNVLPRLKKLGYSVYALAPDTAQSLSKAQTEHGLGFTVLLDPEMAAIKSLGLAFEVDPSTVETYQGYGIQLLSPPDVDGKVLPVPAVYLVDADGTITFAHWQADYKKRLNPQDVLAVAEGRLFENPITYKDSGKTFHGTLAYDPSKKGRRPGVLVIHEWWGLNAYPRRRARQLAAMGYVALAADMYGNGVVTTDSGEAATLAGALRADRMLMRQRAARALSVLKEDPRVDPNRIAAIGYCFGGGVVLELARSGADLSGVVSFHGNLDTPHPDATKTPAASILVCHGAADPHVPMEDVDAFADEMHGSEADWQLNMYGGAVHAFTNPDSGNDPSTGAAYDSVAASRAWNDMKSFFDEIFSKSKP